MKSITHLALTKQRKGVQTVGVLTLRGFSVISDEELTELLARAAGLHAPKASEIVQAFNLAKVALRTPPGTFKTRKARVAYEAIEAVMRPQHG